MNPIPQEKPLAIIGSIHAEDGKIFHVHRSSVSKERTLVEMRQYIVKGETEEKGKKVSYRGTTTLSGEALKKIQKNELK